MSRQNGVVGSETRKKKSTTYGKNDNTGKKPSALSTEYVVDSDSDEDDARSASADKTAAVFRSPLQILSKEKATSPVPRTTLKPTVPAKRKVPPEKSKDGTRSATEGSGVNRAQGTLNKSTKVMPSDSAQSSPRLSRKAIATLTTNTTPEAAIIRKAEPPPSPVLSRSTTDETSSDDEVTKSGKSPIGSARPKLPSSMRAKRSPSPQILLRAPKGPSQPTAGLTRSSKYESESATSSVDENTTDDEEQTEITSKFQSHKHVPLRSSNNRLALHPLE